jgi:hypothetical protein
VLGVYEGIVFRLFLGINRAWNNRIYVRIVSSALFFRCLEIYEEMALDSGRILPHTVIQG